MDIFNIILLFLGILVFLLLGELLTIFFFKKESLKELENHVMIKAFNQNDRKILLILFPLTMLMEELIFRLYSLWFLSLYLETLASILISSIIFGCYHFHFLKVFNNISLVLLFVGYSFLLGLYLAYIFLNFGFLACFLLHYSIIFFTYLEIYRKRFKKKN